MNMFKSNGGFTLVELIVVIAILAILAGVAVPAYSGYIARANNTAVLSELEALETAAVAVASLENVEITKIVVDEEGAYFVLIPDADTTEVDDDNQITDTDGSNEYDLLDVSEFFSATSIKGITQHADFSELGCYLDVAAGATEWAANEADFTPATEDAEGE